MNYELLAGIEPVGRGECEGRGAMMEVSELGLDKGTII
jgi:hypothetical protein